MSEITVLPDEPTPPLFASADDVWVRLGRPLPFTEDETTRTERLLQMAAAAIASACDRPDGWTLLVVPPALRITSIEMVVRVLQNPGGARSTSETLGSHSRSMSFADSSAALELTAAEAIRCRRAIFKSSIASIPAGSILDKIGDAIGGGSALRDGITSFEEADA